MNRRTTTILVIMLGLAAFVLRAYGLGSRELWIDEGFTYLQAREGVFPGIPPLYFWMLRPITAAMGFTALALRLPSFAADLLFILLSGLLVRRLFGKISALIMVVVMTFSPFLVYYAQEARYYALLNVLLAGLCLVVVSINDAKHILMKWILLFLLGAGAFLTHYLAALPVAMLLVAAAKPVLTRHGRRGVVFLIILGVIGIGCIGGGLLLHPSVIKLIQLDTTFAGGFDPRATPWIMVEFGKHICYLLYVYTAGFIHVFTYLDSMLDRRLLLFLQGLPILALVVPIMAGFLDRKRAQEEREALWFCAAVVFSAFLMIFTVEFGFHFYNFQARHTSFVMLFLLILLSVGLQSLWRFSRPAAFLCAIVLSLYAVGGLWVYHRSDLKAGLERWSPILRDVAAQAPGGVIVVSPTFYPSVVYYRDQLAPNLDIVQYPFGWREYAAGTREAAPDEKERKLEEAVSHPTVWVFDARHSLTGEVELWASLDRQMKRTSTSTYLFGQGSSYALPTIVTRFDCRDTLSH